MIKNYLVDDQTKEASGVFDGESFLLPARLEGGQLIALSSQECETILAERKSLKKLVAANAYKKQRAQAYPSIADQLDQIYHEGIDAWKATIQAVKDKYPKGAQ